MKAGLSRAALANMCCGLFGVQIVWGLQNVNTSRIFQTLGAELDQLPILWIAAPITGLVIQPVIGHLSDRTWGPLGRRRPYVLAGAIASAVALVLMPNAGTLWAASLMLWLLTGAINVAMEPFRALVADLVPERQRSAAFAMQVVFIGAGAVVASALPWILSHGFGLAAEAPPGVLPPSLRVAYYIGAIGLLASVVLSVATTREHPPGTAVDGHAVARAEWASTSSAMLVRNGALWIAGAVAITTVTALRNYRPELYLIAGLAGVLGIGQWATAWSARHGVRPTGLLEIIDDVIHMPAVLRRLAVVQFFTWFGLFTLPYVVARIGRREAHALCLLLGAAGLTGFAWIGDPGWLLVPALGIGCAWASILSAPYAMVSSAVPPARMGVYMGIHNVFLVIPQLVATALLGWVVHALLGDRPGLALMLAAGALGIAALLALTIPDHAGRRRAV